MATTKKSNKVSPATQRARTQFALLQAELAASREAENEMREERNNAQGQISDSREAFMNEREVKNQLRGQLEALQAEKTSKLNVVAIEFNGMLMKQTINKGDAFKFEHFESGTHGGFKIVYDPVFVPASAE